MSNDTRNYYERELDLIDFNGKHPAKILIGSEGKTTRTLDINKESAAALIHRLTAFLLNPEPKEESNAPLDVPPTRPEYSFARGLTFEDYTREAKSRDLIVSRLYWAYWNEKEETHDSK